jgi:hypothetical protein
VLIDTLREQCNGLAKLDEQVAEIERSMREWKKDDHAGKDDQRDTGSRSCAAHGCRTAPLACACAHRMQQLFLHARPAVFALELCVNYLDARQQHVVAHASERITRAARCPR